MKSAVKFQNPHFNDYKYFLKLHIKLLAKLDCRRISIKDYYPIDCLDDIKDDNAIIKEARAFLYKRCGDIDNSLTIFLSLLEEISYDEIKQDGFHNKKDDSKFTLSFSKIYTEICQLCVKWTSIPSYKDKIWNQVLRTLFKIKKKYYVKEETKKTKAVNTIIFSKISEFLLMMSRYVDFREVIKLLLEVDEGATFRYSKKWFQSLFVSKADQEFLYKSAQKLLNNENSAMVDSIVDKYQHGFKGTKNQTCDLCKGILVNPYFERSLVFCMCKHHFHRKCYIEEVKLIKTLEVRPDIEKRFQCPICRKHNVDIDEKQRKDRMKQKRSNRRRNRKGTDTRNSSSEGSRSSMNNNDEEYGFYNNSKLDEVEKINYKLKMKAFDEDYYLSSPSIVFP